MPKSLVSSLLALAAFISALIPANIAHAAPTLPDFSAATFVPGAPVTNPFFPMTDVGTTRVYIGESLVGDPIDERFELTNLGLGPSILGVQTFTQLDRAFENGLIVEETRDYFAQDSNGNVWYFGEDVTNFIYDDDGNLVGTTDESAWRAGVNDALPGFIMPVDDTVGFNYFQEFAPNDGALDEGTIFANGVTFDTPVGTFTDVRQILETTSLDPNFREFKYYAPGVGLVGALEGLDANNGNPRSIFRLSRIVAVPEPGTWMTMLLGFGAMGVVLRRRKKVALLQLA